MLMLQIDSPMGLMEMLYVYVMLGKYCHMTDVM